MFTSIKLPSKTFLFQTKVGMIFAKQLLEFKEVRYEPFKANCEIKRGFTESN